MLNRASVAARAIAPCITSAKIDHSKAEEAQQYVPKYVFIVVLFRVPYYSYSIIHPTT